MPRSAVATQLLGRRAAAAYLGLSVRSLDALVARGDLPVVRLPNGGTVSGGLRRVLLHIEDLNRLIERSKTRGPES